ncbi:unnamed protein product [Prorocentrum cordatum]|uniref:Uncharacterized protein n=1 Tax=Prorocentrum cordatum TaxID=2364126 RepID=A0ABN9TR10_9DINO|nr:unnamed protein product [Polarella glacialis]
MFQQVGQWGQVLSLLAGVRDVLAAEWRNIRAAVLARERVRETTPLSSSRSAGGASACEVGGSTGCGVWRCGAWCGRRRWSLTTYNAKVSARKKGEQWQRALAIWIEMRVAKMGHIVIFYNAGICACGRLWDSGGGRRCRCSARCGMFILRRPKAATA